MASINYEVTTESDNSLSMTLMVKSIKAKFSKVDNISTRQLHQWIVDNSNKPDGGEACLVILDCREKAEYEISHIEDAVLVDPEAQDLHATVEKIQYNKNAQDVNVVCYCSLGYRSCRYAKALEIALKNESSGDINFNVYNLEGSLFKWANEKRAMVNAQGLATTKCHPYNAVFGKVLHKDYRYYAETS